MPQNLRVLLIEDSENDAELLLRQLDKAGYAVFSERVLTGADMESALGKQTWDIVIADFRLPRFDAPSALALLKKSGYDLPFIVVSGAVGEEAAVGLMKAGASDYLMKDNLVRLAPVVERELGEARRRAEYRGSEKLLRENEARFRAIFENSPVALWDEDFSAVRLRIDSLRATGVTDFRAYFNAHPDEVRTCAGLIRVVDTNQRSLELYKASSKEQLLACMDKIIPHDLPGAFVDELVMIAAGSRQFEHETVNMTLDGDRIDIHLNWMAVSGQAENLSRVIVSVQDITERKQAEALIQRQLSELEVLFQNSLAINQLMDPRQIAGKVIDLLETELGWHRAAIRLHNPRTGRVELLALSRHGQNPELEAQEANLSQKITDSGQGLSGWVYTHGQAVRSPHVQADSRYFETYPGIRSGLYVPLRAGEHIIGSISVESEQDDAFHEQDERLLTTIANQAAVSIEKAQLFVTAHEELAARVQAQAELVSAHARLEQRVVERTAELRAANLELEKAARLKDEFLASMSHELRTPLTGILGLSDVLQLQSFGNLSEKQLAALKNISTSGRHLLELINDILDLSKIEARHLVLRPGPCELKKICQSSLNAIAGQCQQKNLATSLVIEPSDLKVQADAQRLKQILANLLSNAVKFTPPGGKLGLEVSADSAAHTAHITVWDTGIGIRAEDLPRLFQTFVQLDASLARKYNGTGLGLALVKRLTELHGGSVSVESIFGAGSRFTIQLPLAPV